MSPKRICRRNAPTCVFAVPHPLSQMTNEERARFRAWTRSRPLFTRLCTASPSSAARAETRGNSPAATVRREEGRVNTASAPFAPYANRRGRTRGDPDVKGVNKGLEKEDYSKPDLRERGLWAAETAEGSWSSTTTLPSARSSSRRWSARATRRRKPPPAEKKPILAKRRQPSLVLLDVKLPDISGHEVCRQLREFHGEALPIVLLSGMKTDDLDRTAVVPLGCGRLSREAN